MEELRGVEEKWRLIGRELKILGVPSGVEMDDINYPATTDCLREVFKRWLDWAGTTWGDIIAAVKKAGEPQVADSLKAKYIPGELPTTTSSQYSLESQHEECTLLKEWSNGYSFEGVPRAGQI